MPSRQLPAEIYERLEAYKNLLGKYHNALDLLSARALLTIDEKIETSLKYAEILDDLMKRPFVAVDVGSGSGLPAVPLALALPHCAFHLVERRQRRSAFLNIVKSQLELSNVSIHTCDAEALGDLEVDVVTALAVASFETLYCLTRRLHKEQVVLISRKGADYDGELRHFETNLGLKVEKTVTTPLPTHGTLVAVAVAGGAMCRSSGS